jgi:short-chain 2-methylacyl-CoA dehydrogenase
MGGVGFTRELGIEKYWRYLSFFVIPGVDLRSDSKIGAIYEGTSNIQMDTIFRQLSKQYGRGN